MTLIEKIAALEKKVEIMGWFLAYIAGERLSKLVKAIEDAMVAEGGASSWLLQKDIPDYCAANDKANKEFERLRNHLIKLQIKKE